MLNVKKVLTKILESLAVTTPTVTITASTGTVAETRCKKVGNIVELSIGVKKSTATNAGSNVFEGTVPSGFRPEELTNGVGYYGSCVGIGQILTTGALSVRIAGAQLPADAVMYITFTYML